MTENNDDRHIESIVGNVSGMEYLITILRRHDGSWTLSILNNALVVGVPSFLSGGNTVEEALVMAKQCITEAEASMSVR